MAPGGFWVVSEFHIPQRGAARPFARLLIRALYLAFRIVTGLRVTEIPDYPFVFERSGLMRIQGHDRLFGILRSELWLRP